MIGRLSSGMLDLFRRPPALMAVSFAVVATAIVANALFLQSRPHPAPLVITRQVETREVVPAKAPETKVQPVQRSDDLVLAVQSALRKVGYYSGSLDGMVGPQTEAAIVAFQAANSLPETGVVSLELLAEIEAAKAGDVTSLTEIAAGDALSQPQSQPEPQPEPQPDSRVAAIQHALAIAAYGPLEADGFFGPATREAIIRFQRDHDLPQTGEISDALIIELRADGALQDN